MSEDTVQKFTVYAKDSDFAMSYGYVTFEVHDHKVELDEPIALDIVFNMPEMFGFKAWDKDQLNKTEYSVPEGYEMAEADYALTQEERDRYLAESAKVTAKIEAGEYEDTVPTNLPLLNSTTTS